MTRTRLRQLREELSLRREIHCTDAPKLSLDELDEALDAIEMRMLAARQVGYVEEGV